MLQLDRIALHNNMESIADVVKLILHCSCSEVKHAWLRLFQVPLSVWATSVLFLVLYKTVIN